MNLSDKAESLKKIFHGALLSMKDFKLNKVMMTLSIIDINI